MTRVIWWAISVGVAIGLAGRAAAWDSRSKVNPTHPTHTYITEWAIDALKDGTPELDKYREALVDGANTEFHELKTSDADIKLGKKYGIDMKKKHAEHRGTNAGTGDVEGWWKDSLEAYKAGKFELAFFYLGVIVHMVEDMGVPAHANDVEHQGTLFKLDNFEFLAAIKFYPNFGDINKPDPCYAVPWRYYTFSRKWTKEDAPDYNDRSAFPLKWDKMTDKQKALLRNRQGRKCHIVKWTLACAVKAFKV